VSLLRKGAIRPIRGFADYSLGFDGNDDVTFSPFTNKISEVTFTIWFKTTDSSKYYEECLFYNGLHGTDGYGLYAGGNPPPRDVRFAVLATAKWWRGWRPGWEWLVGQWQHVALVFIYESETKITLKFYLNGALIDTLTGNANPIAPTTQGILGDNAGAPPNRYLGHNSRPAIANWLDEFRVWERALTDDEIKDDMGRKTPDFEDLVLWLSMNEGRGLTVYDKSGQNNNGTITGATWARR